MSVIDRLLIAKVCLEMINSQACASTREIKDILRLIDILEYSRHTTSILAEVEDLHAAIST